MQRTRRIIAMSIASVGIDIGKLTFHLVALDAHGKVVVRKKFSRKQLLTYTARLKTALLHRFAILDGGAVWTEPDSIVVAAPHH